MGACCTFEGLKHNQTLVSIDISANGLGAEAGHGIAEMLKVNSVLTEIKIQRNQLGAQGASDIAGALASRRASFDLWVDGADIGRVGRLCIADVLKGNANLKVHLEWPMGRSFALTHDPLEEPVEVKDADDRTIATSLIRPPELEAYYDS